VASGGTTLADYAYSPAGAVTAKTLGNGIVMSETLDSMYRVANREYRKLAATALLAAALFLLLGAAGGDAPPTSPAPPTEPPAAAILAPPSAGTFSVGKLVYAGTESPVCFGEDFLRLAAERAGISVAPRLRAVRLERAEEIFACPVLVFSGEREFALAPEERANLRAWLAGGGWLVATAGCSRPAWDQSFREEIARLGGQLVPLPPDAPRTQEILSAAVPVAELRPSEGRARPLEGLFLAGRLVGIYSRQGLNDTAHASGCCCCGGSEILNAPEVLASILAWGLRY
jgi:hypothetical protein